MPRLLSLDMCDTRKADLTDRGLLLFEEPPLKSEVPHLKAPISSGPVVLLILLSILIALTALSCAFEGVVFLT